MDQEHVLSIVRRYRDELGDSFGPVQVYLYGSYSTNSAREWSDIDIAVVFPCFNGDWHEVSAMLWKIGWKISNLIEPVLIDASHPSPLYDEVLRTGIAA